MNYYSPVKWKTKKDRETGESERIPEFIEGREPQLGVMTAMKKRIGKGLEVRFSDIHDVLAVGPHGIVGHAADLPEGYRRVPLLSR